MAWRVETVCPCCQQESENFAYNYYKTKADAEYEVLNFLEGDFEVEYVREPLPEWAEYEVVSRPNTRKDKDNEG